MTLLRISFGNGLPAGSVKRISGDPFFFFFKPNPPRLTTALEPARSCEALLRFVVGVPGGLCSALLPISNNQCFRVSARIVDKGNNAIPQ